MVVCMAVAMYIVVFAGGAAAAVAVVSGDGGVVWRHLPLSSLSDEGRRWGWWGLCCWCFFGWGLLLLLLWLAGMVGWCGCTYHRCCCLTRVGGGDGGGCVHRRR